MNLSRANVPGMIKFLQHTPYYVIIFLILSFIISELLWQLCYYYAFCFEISQGHFSWLN